VLSWLFAKSESSRLKAYTSVAYQIQLFTELEFTLGFHVNWMDTNYRSMERCYRAEILNKVNPSKCRDAKQSQHDSPLMLEASETRRELLADDCR
jgi:hypothetical protein